MTAEEQALIKAVQQVEMLARRIPRLRARELADIESWCGAIINLAMAGAEQQRVGPTEFKG